MGVNENRVKLKIMTLVRACRALQVQFQAVVARQLDKNNVTNRVLEKVQK